MIGAIDCSITLAWLLPDEKSSATDAIFDQVVEHGAVVPGHWRLEVANALLMAQRRGRITDTQRRESLHDLGELGLEEDPHTSDRAWARSSELAVAHRLSVYDAAYLELAIRRNTGLATLDGALRSAAAAEGVALLPA